MLPNGTSPRWVRTLVANLVRHSPSGDYSARVRVAGKLILESIRTEQISPPPNGYGLPGQPMLHGMPGTHGQIWPSLYCKRRAHKSRSAPQRPLNLKDPASRKIPFTSHAGFPY
jgi:hypothetical protein